MKKTPLVILFGGTLRSMARQAVTPADLDNAIFYLGCTEAHAKSKEAAMREMYYLQDKDHRVKVYEEFRAAMNQAESHGRAAWRQPSMANSWKELNDLLIANGLPIIVPIDSDGLNEDRYSYPGVVRAVHGQNLPYEVIWTRS